MATLVDHKTPHRGDPERFWDQEKNWQGLCATCHSGAKRELENTGITTGISISK